jgi:hyperosmotically inducible protein
MRNRLYASILVAVACLSPVPAADKKPVSDDVIYDYVIRRLASDPVVKGAQLKVDVKDGIVQIRGTVETEKQKDRAEKVVKKMDGVKGVTNELQVARK